MSAWTLVGMAAAFCTTACWVPQAWKSLRTQSAKDFSWTYLFLMSVGVPLWAIYGYARCDPAVLGANLITFLFLLPVVIVKVRSRLQPEGSTPQASQAVPGVVAEQPPD